MENVILCEHYESADLTEPAVYGRGGRHFLRASLTLLESDGSAAYAAFVRSL